MSAQWWIGAYGADMDGTSEGIARAATTADGTIEILGLATSVQSPTFLAERDGTLYAAAEGSARVERFTVSGDALEHAGGAPSGGGWPCQLEFIDGAVIVANYEGGEIGVVVDDALVQVIPSEGSGPLPEQAGPHAHCAFRVDASTVLTADLGADRVFIHTVEGTTLTRTGAAVLPPGTGPRDIARHPSGLIYVLGEHGTDLHVFEWTGGQLVAVASAPLPGALATDQAAAIGFSSDGRFVYAGLRGSNQIAVLAVSADGRDLSPVGAVSCGGDWPRHFVVEGDLLHVANQLSNSIASFRLGSDGVPALIAEPTPVASPTYLLKRPSIL